MVAIKNDQLTYFAHLKLHYDQLLLVKNFTQRIMSLLFLCINYAWHIQASCCAWLQNMSGGSFRLWELRMVCGRSTLFVTLFKLFLNSFCGVWGTLLLGLQQCQGCTLHFNEISNLPVSVFLLSDFTALVYKRRISNKDRDSYSYREIVLESNIIVIILLT